MTLTKKLASALCLAFLFITLSSDAQVDSTTGNLINFTGTPTTTTSNWNNAGSVGAPLTCWQGGDPGYCGPNPRISAWGANSNVINFSYGQVNLNQVININAGLASVGSNVRLSGFNFGFTAKNGNGWDDGRQDYLSAYVQIYDSKGSVVENYDYTQQTNRRYGWTNFNFSETFTKSYAPSTLSTAQVGFIGRDNNYWVGPYGPEIINVSFALKYTIKADPCIADPLSSPTCPGYAVATIKNSILGSTVSNASAMSYSTANTYTPSPSTNTYNSPASTEVALASPTLDLTQPTQQNTQSAQQQQTQQVLQTPQSSLTQDTNQNPSMAQDNPAQPSTQQSGPVSTTPQPAGGPSQTTQSSSPSASTGTSQSVPGRSNDGPRMTPSAALSVARAAQEKDKATQAMAVQAAAKTLEGSIQQSQASSNTAISMVQDMSTNSAIAAAQFSNQSTQASVQAALQSSQPQQFLQTNTQSQQSPQTNKMVQVQQQQEVQTSQVQSNSGVVQIQQFIYTPPQQQQEIQSTQVAMLKPPTPPVVEMQQQSNSGTGITVSRNLFAYNPLIASNTANMSAPLPTQQPMYQPKLDTRQSEVETTQFQIASYGGSRAGNPLSEFMMEQRFELMQTSIAQPSSSVNRNVLPNELAGGIDIASISSIPTGFNAYSFILKDASFYEPKEVYKNQRTVDNERVLRGLTRGSDSLHQQMVDQQFKLGE